MTNQKLEELKKKIVEAVPSVDQSWNKKICGHLICNCEDRGKFERVEEYRDITLEDVLLAVIKLMQTRDEQGKTSINVVMLITKLFNEICSQWTMLEPLHLQSEETINFLHSILCG